MSSNPHKPSILVFALFTFSIIGLWGLAFSAFILGVFNLAVPKTKGFTPEMDFSVAAILLFLSVLIVPSLINSYKHMLGHPIASSRIGSKPLILVLLAGVWLSILPLGNWIGQICYAGLLVMPIANLLAFVIPIYLLVVLALHNSQPINPQRPWGILNYAMIGGTTLSFIFETLVVVALFIGMTGFLATMPQLRESLQQMRGSLPNLDQTTIEKLTQILFSNPSSIYILLLIVSVATPLVEESVKPLGILFFRSSPLRPENGFFMGVLSGAGFGLLESLMASIQATGADWVQLAIVRIGSDCMHITASGLVGWGVVSLFWQKDWKRFVINFLLAIGLHGLWNSLAIAIGVFEVVPGLVLPGFAVISKVAPAILITLSILSILALWILNRRFFHNRDITVEVKSML